MHGYTMPTEEAIDFCEEIRKAKKLSAMPGIEEISRPRREVLPYGALVLERLLKRLEPSAVHFSVFGIREGLVYSLLSEPERRKDPLLSFCAEYARLRSRSAEHAFELCAWTDALFEPPGPKETEEERRLRHAACLLSDISWRAHPDYRGEQSLILIAHAALGGIDHPGARLPGAHQLLPPHGHRRRPRGRGRDKLSERLKAIVSKKLYKRARIIGAAIRAAHMLSIGQPGIIDETPLSYERNKTRADRAQSLRGARRRAPAPPLRGPGRAAGAGARDPRQAVAPPSPRSEEDGEREHWVDWRTRATIVALVWA